MLQIVYKSLGPGWTFWYDINNGRDMTFGT